MGRPNGQSHPHAVVAAFVLLGALVLLAGNLYVWVSLSNNAQATGTSADGAHASMLVLEFIALAVSIPYFAVKAKRMRSRHRAGRGG